jgi:alpha-L-rhamnosidase
MVVQNFDAIAEMSRGTGRAEAADMYDAMVPKLKADYHAAFYDPVGQIYGDGTPTAFGAALWLGVTPEELLPAVVANFIKQLASVEYRMDTVGFIGVRYIFEALAKVNRTDVALKMLNVTDYPSFGYQITNTLEPATSLWESYVA